MSIMFLCSLLTDLIICIFINTAFEIVLLNSTFHLRQVFRDFLWWLWLCAREKNCIGHRWNIYCSFRPDRYTKFAECHRFDQSAINIILSNIWLRDKSRDYTANQTFFYVMRYPTKKYKLKTCT